MSDGDGSWFTLSWRNDAVVLLDQRLLPGEERYLAARDVETLARAIETLAVRGAPAIGCAAALGVALGAVCSEARDVGSLVSELETRVWPRLERTRPTAVNLFWALARMREELAELAARADSDVESLRRGLIRAAVRVLEEDRRICRDLGRAGAPLVPQGARIMTHCNAGALATGGYGTALGVVRAATEAGCRPSVLAGETRPLLQGARLTAWELQRDGIPVTVFTDNMAGWLMRCGEVDLVVVGADRIAANGDSANKIGTYGLAVLAREHGLPFFVAAPLSTIDRDISSGDGIPIEERGREEVARIGECVVLPEGVPVRQPAFDVTPAELISAIVTERGVVRPPFEAGLAALFEAAM